MQIIKKIFKKIFKILYFFPIKNNRIVFEAYKGTQYSCNPKYIYKKIIEKYPHKFDLIWVLDDPKKLTFGNAKTIKRNSFLYIFYMMTARIIICNSGFNAFIPYRKTQLKINTWHGGGAYKKVGVDRNCHDVNKAHIKANGEPTDILLSSCHQFSQVFPPSYGINPQAVWEIGMPRNDLLIHQDNEQRKIIRRKLGLNNQTNLVLYAPTYRGSFETATLNKCSLDVDSLLNSLKKRFGGVWEIGYRVHYAYRSHFNFGEGIDLSNYPDMQELLLATDVLLTDYSSSIWDYSFTQKPCFLYIPDVVEYKKEVDFYTPIEEWPFPKAITNAELTEKILTYDETDYVKALQIHQEKLGCCETGGASESVADLIFRYAMTKLSPLEVQQHIHRYNFY